MLRQAQQSVFTGSLAVFPYPEPVEGYIEESVKEYFEVTIEGFSEVLDEEYDL